MPIHKTYSQKSPYSLLNDFYRYRREGMPVTGFFAQALIEKMPNMFYLDENGEAHKKVREPKKKELPKIKRTPQGFIDYEAMSDEDLEGRLVVYGDRIFAAPRRLADELVRRFPDKYEITKRGHLSKIGGIKREKDPLYKGIPGIDYIRMPFMTQIRGAADDDAKAQEFARAYEEKTKVEKAAPARHIQEKKFKMSNLPLQSIKNAAGKYSLIFSGAVGTTVLIKGAVEPYEVLLIDSVSHFTVVRKYTNICARLFIIDLLYGKLPAETEDGFMRVEYMNRPHDLYGFKKIGDGKAVCIDNKTRQALDVSYVPEATRSVYAQRDKTIVINPTGVETTMPMVVLGNEKTAKTAERAMDDFRAISDAEQNKMGEHSR